MGEPTTQRKEKIAEAILSILPQLVRGFLSNQHFLNFKGEIHEFYFNQAKLKIEEHRALRKIAQDNLDIMDDDEWRGRRTQLECDIEHLSLLICIIEYDDYYIDYSDELEFLSLRVWDFYNEFHTEKDAELLPESFSKQQKQAFFALVGKRAVKQSIGKYLPKRRGPKLRVVDYDYWRSHYVDSIRELVIQNVAEIDNVTDEEVLAVVMNLNPPPEHSENLETLYEAMDLNKKIELESLMNSVSRGRTRRRALGYHPNLA